MIPISDKHLEPEDQVVLDALQQRVDVESTFDARKTRAVKLWDTKGGKKGNVAFEKIRQILESMTVYTGICNYCEQNEANDIEHVDPKSFFPQRAFVWKNYILACKQCNSGLKLDRCHVFDQNDSLQEMPRGTEPISDDPAFINPRISDPNDFMILDLRTYLFAKLPDLSDRDKRRMESTIGILELNGRDTLINARKSAAIHYFETLQRLISILSSSTIAELKSHLNPFDNLFDFSLGLQELKDEIKESYKKYISTYQHPSVWYSIKKIESKINAQWKILFDTLPEALTW